MTRCKKSQTVVMYNNSGVIDKFCVVWEQYKYRDDKLKIYYNGHGPGEWGYCWDFVIKGIIIESESLCDSCYLDIARFGWQEMVALGCAEE